MELLGAFGGRFNAASIGRDDDVFGGMSFDVRSDLFEDEWASSEIVKSAVDGGLGLERVQIDSDKMADADGAEEIENGGGRNWFAFASFAILARIG